MQTEAFFCMACERESGYGIRKENSKVFRETNSFVSVLVIECIQLVTVHVNRRQIEQFVNRMNEIQSIEERV